MADSKAVDIDALFEQGDPIKDAIRRGSREAMKRHIAAGVPMVSWKDDKVVTILPDELIAMLKAGE